MAIVRLVNPHAKQRLTRNEVERRQAKAVQFTRDVVGDPGLADEIESLSAEEYAASKGFQLSNPKRKGVIDMANTHTQQSDRNAELDRLSDALVERVRSRLAARRSNPAEEQSENAKLDKVIVKLEELCRDRVKNPGDNSEGIPSPRADRRVKKLLAERDDILDSLQEAQDQLDEGQPESALEIIDEILDRFDFEDD
jgi:hypothetical protein